MATLGWKEFAWDAPDGEPGLEVYIRDARGRRFGPYREWVEAVRKYPPGYPPHRRPLPTIRIKGKVRLYYPMRDEPTLFRNFADVDESVERCMAFVERFGLLGLFRDEICDEKMYVESIADWLVRVQWMKHMLTIWDAAKLGEPLHPSPFFHRDERGWHFNGPPPPPRLSGKPSRHKELVSVVREADLPNAARVAVLRSAIEEARDGLVPELVRPTFPIVGFHPRNLWSAMVLQLIDAVDNDKTTRRCLACGRWFLLTPGTARADKTTCSGSCRTRLHRERKREGVSKAKKKGGRDGKKETR